MRLSKQLLKLIKEFKKQNPKLANRESAAGCCTDASYAFRELAVGSGLRCDTWEIVLDKNHDQYLCPRWYPDIAFEGHCVVYTGNVVIDWTARQYNPKAPFPLIYHPPKQACSVVSTGLFKVVVKTGLVHH
jgi:hypothetical protein